ncbi:MAG TPA: chromate resistance protein ChrB domain-containing protein [Thermoanaerobaculia bacterium]|nr:chromate resistance protein ChrB domain-containing protein [Thermoanaerobaculia bacterium]
MARATWLLLIHQIPAKPDYLRVKVGRRLQQVGAVAVKSSVYALPNNARSREHFEWILREVIDARGEAVLCTVDLLDGLSDEDLATLFREARTKDYEALSEDIGRALAALEAEPTAMAGLGATLLRLEKRLISIRAIDHFDAPGHGDALSLLSDLRQRISGARRGSGSTSNALGRPTGATWVTRPGVEEDRIASAWLIRRFIDPTARFRFAPEGSTVAAGEIRFDMFDAEYTHEGDRCTFEVLLERFGLIDPALSAIAEIVHEIDLRDEKFGRTETSGVERLIRGIVLVEPDDGPRISVGGKLFDCLYAALGGTA